MTLRFLVFGRTGQVASELLARAGAEIHVRALGREHADLRDPKACVRLIRAAARLDTVDVVINAAAFTAVDAAEDAPNEAWAVNATAPAAMAEACAREQIPLLHLSTDYVFGGAGTNWRESDQTSPQCVYGKTKRAGEIAVQKAGGPHAILRTAWVFSPHGRNFVKTILRAGAAGGPLQVVDDQVGCPTPASAIADALIRMAQAFNTGQGTNGLFHFAGTPGVSWFGLAGAIFAAAPWAAPQNLTPIATDQWPTRARRPLDSTLNCEHIAQAYGIPQPDWQDHLHQVVKALRDDVGPGAAVAVA